MAKQGEHGIAWTEETWNPLRGCSRISEGCRFCYAEAVAARFSGPGQPYEGLAKMTSSGPRWTGALKLVEKHLADPIRWKTARRVFVNSMSDIFHETVPDEWIDRIFAVMAFTPQHTFQLLTKRADRMYQYFASAARPPVGTLPERYWRQWQVWAASKSIPTKHDLSWYWNREETGIHGQWPLPNVWLGVSTENQKTADERIPWLLQTPAAIRWISYEPALGPIEFDSGPVASPHRYLSVEIDHPEDRSLDWIVVGGESGSGARPFDIQWAYDTIYQCRHAGIPVFVKQLGAVPVDSSRMSLDKDHLHLQLRDRKGGDMSEWPEALRVREYPNV